MAKKIISKKVAKRVLGPALEPTLQRGAQENSQNIPIKKRCVFCKQNSKPSYTDAAFLRKFINDRGKILPKLRTGTCSKHQRMVTKQIKYARHLALLPFTQKV